MEENIFEQRTDLEGLKEAVEKLKAEIGKVIIGQQNMLELLLAAILADGHVLIEGVPGVAKTLTAKLLSRAVDVGFSRIQFTPDLMPSDVTGTSVFDPKTMDFEFRQGPIFSNIILIDEINRAPAKTQAALFEVMEERQITVDGKTYYMQPPFLVVATQNPVEQEGTYHLPEAQLDRFLFKINVNYPNLQEELQVLLNHQQKSTEEQLQAVLAVLSASQISELRLKVRSVLVEEKLLEYIVRVVGETRNHKDIYLGASPRASIGILNGARSIAAMHGRDFVIPDDILFVTTPVLRHRIVLSPEKEMEGTTTDEVIQQILDVIEIPR